MSDGRLPHHLHVFSQPLCTVLHPLTRLDLQCNGVEDTVVLRALSLAEEVRLTHRTAGDCESLRRLRLERVHLHIVEDRPPLPAWRRPDTPGMARLPGPPFDSCTGTVDGELCIEPPAELGDVPLRIGAFFPLPWSSHGPETELYRLVAAEGDEKNPAVDAADGYILLRDLVEVVGAQRLTMMQRSRLSRVTVSVAPRTPLSPPSPPHCSGSQIFETLRANPCHRATLVAGETGSGKTHTALVLAAAAYLVEQRPTVYLNCRRLKNARGLRLPDILRELAEACECCQGPSPVVLVLDDLDELVPHLGSDTSVGRLSSVQQHNPALLDQCQAIAGLLIRYFRHFQELRSNVTTIFTCREPENLSCAVLDACHQVRNVRLPCLSSDDRIHLFHSLLGRLYELNCSREDAVQSMLDSDFGHQTLSFRPRDLEQLAYRVRAALVKDRASDLRPCLEQVLQDFVPLSQRVALAERSPEVYTFQHVGGLFDVKRELTASVLRPSKYGHIYRRAQVRLPRGVLLFGPPGCGKSFIVPALARECGYPLISCRGPELLDKYIGASETKVREIFARAAAVAPSMLWIDELDALAPRRGSDNTGVTDRIVNQLLTLLDGVEDSSTVGTVYILATSSRPDKVDPALLRPGRLEKHLYVGLPEGEGELSDAIFKVSTAYNISDSLLSLLRPGEFLGALKEHCPAVVQFSPADVQSAFNTAQLLAAHEVLDRQRVEQNDEVVPQLTINHLLTAFGSTKPSLGPDDQAKLDAIYSQFGHHSSAKRNRGSSTGDLRVALM